MLCIKVHNIYHFNSICYLQEKNGNFMKELLIVVMPRFFILISIRMKNVKSIAG